MENIRTSQGFATLTADERAQFALVLALGGSLDALTTLYPSRAPFWTPWEFSWPAYLAFACALLWTLRGLALTPPSRRPSAARQIAFFAGFALLYGVTQTHYDYMAQHMFFLNRIQHVVMHHIGPFLVAIAAMGETMLIGAPRPVRRLAGHPAVAGLMRVVQQPALAAALFLGLFFVWLWPPVHFRAMIDPRLYAVMNASMVIDGLLFWSLVLDRRPKPPARAGFATRFALSLLVMFPQILVGALIAFTNRDLYPFYNLCGRLFPSISPIEDQHLGALILWIPPAMMSVVGILAVLTAYLRYEEATSGQADALASR